MAAHVLHEESPRAAVALRNLSGSMSSRQEEKERRRQERLAREQQEARTRSRMRRIQLTLGALLAVAAVGGIVAAITTSGDGPKRKSEAAVPIPQQKITNLTAAARAADCTVRSFPSQGRSHTDKTVKYRTNPPTSGPHHPTWAQDGIYEPGTTPKKEMLVHALEHGRILIQYRPGTPARRIAQLETLFNEEIRGTPGFHQLLFENNTNMSYAVAATSWQQLLGCPKWNNGIFDAIRAFRAQYMGKAPEPNVP